jgi:hypothetical protein
MPLDVREGAEPVDLRLEHPARMERLRDRSRRMGVMTAVGHSVQQSKLRLTSCQLLAFATS